MKLTPVANFINILTRSFSLQKWSGTQLQFHQQNYAQIYLYTQLEVTLNF
jgi:hypothetical protein